MQESRDLETKTKIGFSKRLMRNFASGLILTCIPNLVFAQSLIRDAEIETVIRSYSDPLFVAAGLSPKDVKLGLVSDRSLNAFVTDGQKMYLNTGLILEARTPNQLKGVIAHETGHIAGGHLARSSEAQRNAMVPAYVTIALGLLAIASGASDAGAALLASSQQFALLSFFTYTRVQEASADQAALTYLETTHQSGQGLVTFFEKFRYMEVMAEARREPYFRSHPLSSSRISALESRISRSQYKAAADSAEDIRNLQLIQAKIQGFLYTSEQTFFKYPPSDRSIIARYARAIAFYRAPDIEMATGLVRGLIDDEPNNPYFQELMGQIYFENDQSTLALPYYQKSVELAPDSALLRIGYARTLINIAGAANYELAEAELLTALRLEEDNAFAWNQLAVVADRTGKTGLARLATAEEAFALGDMQRANRFAQVARRNFERSAPQWQRASDIVTITDPLVARMIRRGDASPR
ncbi:MAG: peptidase M48 Ste24p [Hyphomonadaceae bacterium]|nr:MAG: peptidase M48 Ste24p [Hyphomonadaceae bacterium]